jgi:hypothetical protein
MCGSRALERGDASEVRVVVAAVVVSGKNNARQRFDVCQESVILRYFTSLHIRRPEITHENNAAGIS